MPQGQYDTTLEPINGLDAKRILKDQMNQRIDKIPLLKEGNAFKQIAVGFELIFSAFPADCPVPSAEWEILIGLDDGEDLVFDAEKDKIKQLKEKLKVMEDNITRINKFLTKHNPTEIIKEVDSDNGTPDEMRERHGLKIPVIKTDASGKKTQVSVPASQLRSK